MKVTSAVRLVPLSLLAVLALAASGCDMFEAKDPGERIFRRQCASCHGLDGRGNTARYMSNPWADITDTSWKSYGDDGSIETVIREGVFGQMPARNELTREEMRALLGYLRELRGERTE
ncbi:MAG: cytochrome c [Thermoanaerobaculia bacterium]